ncbi:MAG: tetratricopeptide repeat protein [Acidobacteriota bacterium]|nr:MAG: tetratricopeptide repeat protein [Acidobacteriota bacterium]
MKTLSLFFELYYRPASAFSDIMDSGSWIFAAVAVLVVSFAFQYGINSRIAEQYAVGYFDQVVRGERTLLRPDRGPLEADPEAAFRRESFPLIGSRVTWLFSFDSSFIAPLIILTVFFVPGTIILAVLIAKLGNAGVVIGNEYGTFSTCVMTAWAAAHLPFAIAGLAFGNVSLAGLVSVALWAVSGIAFGGLLVFAIRTVFGTNYSEAIITAAFSWIFYSIGVNVIEFVSPWFFSPFLLIFAVLYLGGFLRSGVAGMSDSMRRKRDFKRFLHNATVNPRDADAHVQLGLIYASRRQDEKAKEHFVKAFEIDPEEIDANYQLGRIARREGDLQKAIEHFSTVVAQNDKFALSEIWREIGATYMEAGMDAEARDALEKFVARRPFDGEGLFYLGVLLKRSGESEAAQEMYERAVEAASTAPYHRRNELRKWAKRAQREMT